MPHIHQPEKLKKSGNYKRNTFLFRECVYLCIVTRLFICAFSFQSLMWDKILILQNIFVLWWENSEFLKWSKFIKLFVDIFSFESRNSKYKYIFHFNMQVLQIRATILLQQPFKPASVDPSHWYDSCEGIRTQMYFTLCFCF